MALTLTYGNIAGGAVLTETVWDTTFSEIIAWANSLETGSSFTTTLTSTITTNVLAYNVTNSGDAGSITVSNSGALAATKSILSLSSTTAQTLGTAFLYTEATSAGTTIPIAYIKNAGSGSMIKCVDGSAVSKFEVQSTGAILSSGQFEIKSTGDFVGAPLRPGIYGLGIFNATTTDANDSVAIKYYTGAALSSTNVGYVVMPSLTLGQFNVLKITADVTIKLTGAHWGWDTKGDLTDMILDIIAINDNAVLRWGVTSKSGSAVTLVASAKCSTTQTSATDSTRILTNTAVGADSYAIPAFWTKVNFDDTGGAAENLWSVQTGNDDRGNGASDGIFRSTPITITGVVGQPSTKYFKWTMYGPMVYFFTHVESVGVGQYSNATTKTFAAPILGLNFLDQYSDAIGVLGRVMDNTVNKTTAGTIALDSSSTIGLYPGTMTDTAWTATNAYLFDGQANYVAE